MALLTAGDALRAVSLFETLSDEELDTIGAIAHFDHFNEGETLFLTGDPGTCMWVVVTGQIDIHFDVEGTDVTLASIVRKGILGELSLIEPQARSASARARTDSVLLRIDYSPFAELRDALHPAPYKLLRELSRLVCIRIRSVNQQIELLSRMRPSTVERRKAITDILTMLWKPAPHHG